MDIGGIGLLATGVGLGLRHGIDWDHIAAITDITTASPTDERRTPAVAMGPNGAAVFNVPASGLSESWLRFFLATCYALGHASVVVALGLLALWASEILPAWVDPIMERLVGVTLLFLGIYIFYSLWRNGRSFRLRSRWMLVFAGVGQAWAWLKSRLTGVEHRHVPRAGGYGKRTAFGIGVIHGVGAETGSQALLLASAAGATTRLTGSALLAAFTIGLLISNSLVAALSTWGSVSSRDRQRIYIAVGVVAGVFSLVVGFVFVMGSGAALPDLQRLLGAK